MSKTGRTAFSSKSFAAAAFVAIAVHGFFDTPYYKNDLSVEFWMVAALEVAAIRAFLKPTTGNPPLQR